MSNIVDNNPPKIATGTRGATIIFAIIPYGARFPKEKRVIGSVKSVAEILVEIISERKAGICIFRNKVSSGFERIRRESVARKES